MTRVMLFVTCVLTCALLGVPTRADDPPKKLTPEERKELVAKQAQLNAAAFKAYQAGEYPEAVKAFDEALKLARRLFPKDEYPNGHTDLAYTMTYLTLLY